MSIFLIRHGETPLNVARVLQPADTPLSTNGLAQAEAVARRLASLGVTHILSSDLPRALATARAIAAATQAPIETSALLHARNFGDLRGQRFADLDHDPTTRDEAPPGGESVAEFRARVAQAFALVVATRARIDGNLAVVTHGLVIRTILGLHVTLPNGGPVALQVANTSMSVIAMDAPHAVSLLDCASHLDVQDEVRSLSGGPA